MFTELIKGFMYRVDVDPEVPLQYTENGHYRELIRSIRGSSDSWATKLFDLEYRGVKPFYGIYQRSLENRVVNRNICKRLKLGEYDIFHPTYYDHYFLDCLGDVPYVVTIHDMIPEVFGWEHPVIEQKRILVQRSSKVIAVSENTKNDLLKFYDVPEENVTVVYHGSSLYSSNQHPKLQLDLPQRYILFTGKRSAYKNFSFFIESIAPLLLAEKDLFVICTKVDRSRNSFSDAERKLFDSLNITKQVVEVNTSDLELVKMYEGALCYVCPSRYEGFGIPIIEAFYCNCPTVVSNTSALSEIAGDAAVYFDPSDSSSIYRVVNEVVSNPDLRASLREKGKIRRSHFSWANCIEQTLSVYKSVVRN